VTPYYSDSHVRIYHGDCREVLPSLDPVETCITDPPYGLGFMGKDWDHGVPGEHFWRLIADALLPGAMCFAFGGTRTHHRLMVAIEDAGFEIRDSLGWSHMEHVFCQCVPYAYEQGIRSQGVRRVWRGMDTENPVSSDPESVLLDGVLPVDPHVQPKEGAEGIDLPDLRRTVPSPPITQEEPGCGVLLPVVQEQDVCAEVAENRTPGPAGVDGRKPPVIPKEHERSTQPGMEGRCDVQASEGELQAGEDGSVPSRSCDDGTGERLPAGTPPSDGEVDAKDTQPDGVRPPQEPRQPRQPPRESGALAVEWIPQGGGAWPGCPRCGKPLAPPLFQGPLAWNYGSGFPKSLDVGKALDKAAGEEREVVGVNPTYRKDQTNAPSITLTRNPHITAPATEAAKLWDGWGTALKPAWEPII